MELIKLILPLIVPAFIFLIGAITVYAMDETHNKRVLAMFTKKDKEEYKGPTVNWDPKSLFQDLLVATVAMFILSAGYSLWNNALKNWILDKDARIEQYEEYIRKDEARITLDKLKKKIDATNQERNNTD